MARSANEELFDAMVRHQIGLLNYSSYLRNRINTLLRATEEDLAGKILARLDRNNGLSNPAQWNKLAALKEALAVIRGKGWDEATEVLMDEANALAVQEPIYMQSAITGVVPVQLSLVIPPVSQLKAIVSARPFEGRVLKDWAKTMAADDIRRIQNAVQVGMAAGETTDNIVRRVIGTKAMNGADGVTEMTRKQVQAVVRTAVQHVANNARDEFFQSNADIVEQEYFVATLDGRTTPECRANDGKYFPLGKGPRPPLHFSCRSLRIAGLSASFLGQRPMKPVTEKMLLQEYAEQHNLGALKGRNALPKGHKTKFDEFARKRTRELVGTVPSSTTYQEFLGRQPVAFQNEVLGVAKGKLFRDGKLPLDRFVARDGQELTLVQLAKKERQAFIDAGLDPDSY